MEDLYFDCGTNRTRAEATLEQCRRLYPQASVRLTATFDDPPQFRVLVRGVTGFDEKRSASRDRAG
jgi:hypothetical protein